MLFIPEAESSSLVTHEMAYAAIREALLAAAGPGTATFPVVLGHGSTAENRFTVKAAATPELAGLKVGSYWPGNEARGLPRHSSMILLIDQELGRISTAVEAGTVNAYRTAAADAVAADLLARPEARRLAVFGAGHQAHHECMALARVRRLEEILVVARDRAKGEAFAARLAREGLRARPAGAEEACRDADLIVTATPATAPLFDAGWVRPGTHIASMGSDATGKQELPPALFARSSLFCDLPSQSRRIGEFQHAAPELPLVALGDVIAGRHPGRRSPEEITVFDSSGLSIQDLYIARCIVEAASRRRGADRP